MATLTTLKWLRGISCTKTLKLSPRPSIRLSPKTLPAVFACLSPAMSQSSKCDEHRRWLHNAKSLLLQMLQLQLISDGVKRTHTCMHMHSSGSSLTHTDRRMCLPVLVRGM